MGTSPDPTVGVRTTETEPPNLEERQSHDALGRLECHAPSLEKNGKCTSNDILVLSNTARAPVDEKYAADAAETEYPGGFKLLSIILALVMGIFLASLDMVSNRNPKSWPGLRDIYIGFADSVHR